MIKNERQYRVTRAQAEKFARALAALEALPEQEALLPPALRQVERDALAGQIQVLRQQVEEYEALRTGAQRSFAAHSFADLPRALIQARIASGLTQRELAARLGLKEQQIQRYEATEYASASLERVNTVIQALNLDVREEVSLTGS